MSKVTAGLIRESSGSSAECLLISLGDLAEDLDDERVLERGGDRLDGGRLQ